MTHTGKGWAMIESIMKESALMKESATMKESGIELRETGRPGIERGIRGTEIGDERESVTSEYNETTGITEGVNVNMNESLRIDQEAITRGSCT
jgi:hypothetical protein